MAKLSLTYSDLYTLVSNHLGITEYDTAPTGTDLTKCEDIVKRGYRQFLYPIDLRSGTVHQWNFLRKYTTVKTLADQWKLALPVDFSELCSYIHYDSNELQPPLYQRNADQILEMRADVVTSEWPQFFAIVPSKYDLEIGTIYELWLYPTPDQSYDLSFFYRFDPLAPASTTDLLVGGIRCTEAIIESCLAVAETQEEDNTFTHHQAEAARLIQAMIVADDFTDTGKIGNLYYGRGRIWPPMRPYLVAYQDGNIYDGVTPTDEFGTGGTN